MVVTNKPEQTRQSSAALTHTVFVDLDTVLVATHQGRRGIELGMQGDVAEGLDRLSEIADRIVVLAYPSDKTPRGRALSEGRLATLREHLGTVTDQLLLVTCPHGADDDCNCAKPGTGLVGVATEQHELPRRGGWYIGADQEGVVAGRSAGLKTIRIGPMGADHLSAVHRADYEARDLLDAANHILIAELR